MVSAELDEGVDLCLDRAKTLIDIYLAQPSSVAVRPKVGQCRRSK
jgi:hypothetical protein